MHDPLAALHEAARAKGATFRTHHPQVGVYHTVLDADGRLVGVCETPAELEAMLADLDDPADATPRASFSVGRPAMRVIEVGELFVSGSARGVVSDVTRRAGEALRGARPKRSGKGFTHRVVCDVDAAEVIWAYCDGVGQALLREHSKGLRVDGRALMEVRNRITSALIAIGARPPVSQRLPPAPVVPQREVTSQLGARERARRLNAGDDVPEGMVWIPRVVVSASGMERGWTVALRPLGEPGEVVPWSTT